jgi:hypothetical protein
VRRAQTFVRRTQTLRRARLTLRLRRSRRQTPAASGGAVGVVAESSV